MHKIWLIAKRDYLATVRTKAFLIGLIIAPLLFGGGFLAILLLKAKPDVTPQSIAVVDRTGVAAKAVIEELRKQNAKDLFDKKTGVQAMPRFEFEEVVADAKHPDMQRLMLSDRVRNKTLFAFIEIGANSVLPGNGAANSIRGGAPAAGFAWYSNGALGDTHNWVLGPLNEALGRVRLANLGVAPNQFDEVLNSLPLDTMNLVSKDPQTGRMIEARKTDAGEKAVAPIILAMLLYMIVLMISGPMLSAVAEDKMQRVFEMLLTSATPFDLMAGKIMASVGVALTSAACYIIGALFVLQGLAMFGLAPLDLLPWFVVDLVAEVTMLSAIGTALGAACSSPQDAKNLQLIVILPVIVPIFLLLPVLQQPGGSLATIGSFLPLFSPFLMLVRQASPDGVPAWQPWVALVGVAITTLGIAWISSRIFRIAILSQGKTPSVPELVRWALSS